MYETLDYSLQDQIATVKLNRPRKLNAMNPTMVRELRDVADAVRTDQNVRVVVFHGEGRAFSAGADIAELQRMGKPPTFLRFIEDIQFAFNAIEDLDVPTIAALNGLAYGGGCELAVACDFRIMAENASIGVPEIKIGALPGAGGTARLSKMLPPAIAKEMIYFGDPIDSDTALRLGLVNRVVPPSLVLDTAREWAQRLASLPPLALKCAKMLVHAGINADMKTAMEAARHGMGFLYGTEDRNEGMSAFLDKRTAKFSGR
ncbi:MAG TPA: enoyl-CoA hydratase/isomerase family protein [Candidatus Binataceae bacterium]|nr:enoyl-CoA hydratase/isomerase family protein [Candidatus Binataceae bacterium]